MKENQLIKTISERILIPRELAEQMVNSFADIIIETVSEGKKVRIDKLGVFERRSRSARSGRNPKTGEEMIIPGNHAVAFSPADSFTEKLNS